MGSTKEKNDVTYEESQMKIITNIGLNLCGYVSSITKNFGTSDATSIREMIFKNNIQAEDYRNLIVTSNLIEENIKFLNEFVDGGINRLECEFKLTVLGLSSFCNG